MITYSAITKVNKRKHAEGLGLALEKLDPAPSGVGVFELEDGSGEWEVGAYFIEKPDEISLLLLENAYLMFLIITLKLYQDCIMK